MTRGEDGTRFGAGGRRLAHICMCLFYSIMPGVFALPGASVLANSPVHGDTIIVEINGVAQVPGFFPDFLTLHVNDTVTFVNQALPSSNYAISADDGSFASPVIAPGGKWSFTFVSKGAHVYRETTYPQHMVGELLVVDSAVHLLPTPNPFAAATVIAAIKNGQNPPDTLTLPVPTAAVPVSSPVPLILLIIGISGALIVLGALGFAYYQHYQQRNATPLDEDDTRPMNTFSLKQYRQQVGKSTAYVKQKILALPLFQSRRESDDDDDDSDWDQL